MSQIQQKWQYRGVTLFYCLATAVVSHVLLTSQTVMPWLYLLFPAALLVALFLPAHRLWASLLAAAVLLTGGLAEPYELNTVEESFILIPLLFLVLYPGTLWPLVLCFILLGLYIPALEAKDYYEFIEDAVELVVITTFACIMSYFHQLAHHRARHYRIKSETDHLTGLGNRKALYQHLNRLPRQKRGILLNLDIDQFKAVNSLSHLVGDQILILLAQRLSKMCHEQESVYRIGSDEYCLSLPPDSERAEQLAIALCEPENQRFEADGRSYQINFSIGLASFRDCGQNVDSWFQCAELALNRCKQLPGSNWLWFDEQMYQAQVRRTEIEKGLEQAVGNQELTLLYQPKLHLSSNQIYGAEALLRWHHPKLGPLSPGEFIPVAEESQHIVAIGRWVIDQACIQGKAWLDAGRPCPISVNVSAVQLECDDLYRVVEESLLRHHYPGELLQIEITETAIMSQSEHITETCHKLRNLGVQILLDDFGVAYSCLNYLRRLPVDVLKIDKSFVDDCVDEPKAHMLIRTIVQMGHNLNMVVTAEGVENEMQLELLKSEQCDRYQGYLYSPPVTAEIFDGLRAANHSR